ncbi:MAG TPA: YdbH domain-containing protein [Rhizomicrobium sp.]|nr:YdbH domain-containing protein [Rhizomicrobium sp.]
MKRRWLAVILPAAAVVLLLTLWLARAAIAVRFARSYFESHGVVSTVEISELGLSGVSGRFALGPADAPEISARRIELHFAPLRWIPYVTEVQLVDPVVRARVDDAGNISFGSLQSWIDSLNRQQGKSRFVSDDLAVSLRNLRLHLSTPGGALDVGGNVELRKNLPVSLALSAEPALVRFRDTNIELKAANLAYDKKAETFAARFSGEIRSGMIDARAVEASLNATGFNWAPVDGRLSITAPFVHALASASSLAAGQSLFSAPKLDVTARDATVAVANNKIDAVADLAVSGESGLDATLASLRSTDPVLANALRQNLARLAVRFAGHAEQQGGVSHFALTQPLMVTGAKGGSLRLSALTLSGSPENMHAGLGAELNGPNLPAAKVTMKNLLWSGGGFTTDAAFSTRFNFDMLRGTDLAGQGIFSWQNGQYAFTPSGCVRVALTAFHPGASDLAKNVRAGICALPRQPLLTGERIGWTLTGEARDGSADIPLASVHLEKTAARLAFDGKGAPSKGTATVTSAEILDRAPNLRFKPLTAAGTASLGKGIWSGRFTVAGQKSAALGEVTFTHTMASGTGTAHIDAPHITFAPAKLQPADLSPLLVALRRAEGSGALTGDIDWTRDAVTSRGKLTIANLDFMTPLGRAHTVKSEIALSSLLPPIAAPGQSLTISRIDWTLPITAVDVRFGFSPSTIQIAKADTDIAEGHASLGAIALSLANPGSIAGAADIKGISLSALVAASNLGSKLKLDGKVSGHIPFTMGPDGFRIANGHVAADGRGRLSVDRSLWAQGEAAISSNAVQDFAYQALENLAFEQMTADLNSLPNGRLQIVFHIKGKSDPPKPQTANVAIADILNGTALYKPVPLPSGTPIDLTLDTSLNFDELLKSYAEAWSKSLAPEGQQGAAGAKP